VFIDWLVNTYNFIVAVKHHYMKMNGEKKAKQHTFSYLCTRRDELQAPVDLSLGEKPKGRTPEEEFQSRFGLSARNKVLCV
jgi:hypothetical protein